MILHILSNDFTYCLTAVTIRGYFFHKTNTSFVNQNGFRYLRIDTPNLLTEGIIVIFFGVDGGMYPKNGYALRMMQFSFRLLGAYFHQHNRYYNDSLSFYFDAFKR